MAWPPAVSLPPDFDRRFQKGDFTGSIYGHGGSIREPYDTLRLYQSQSIAVPGAHAANFSRWKNPEYDKIVDEVYVTDPDECRQAQGRCSARRWRSGCRSCRTSSLCRTTTASR